MCFFFKPRGKGERIHHDSSHMAISRWDDALWMATRVSKQIELKMDGRDVQKWSHRVTTQRCVVTKSYTQLNSFRLTCKSTYLRQSAPMSFSLTVCSGNIPCIWPRILQSSTSTSTFHHFPQPSRDIAVWIPDPASIRLLLRSVTRQPNHILHVHHGKIGIRWKQNEVNGCR